jgi:hypothetical protein
VRDPRVFWLTTDAEPPSTPFAHYPVRVFALSTLRLVIVAVVVSVAFGVAVGAGPAMTPRLPPETEAGWATYVGAVEARRTREHGHASRFLAGDFLPRGSTDRRALLRGELVISDMPVPPSGREHQDLDVPDAMVHHWRGAIFVPGATLDGLMASLRSGPPADEDVLASAVMDRSPDGLRVYLRLRRTKIVTAVFDTEHVVRFARPSSERAESSSTAVRIVEVDGPDTPRADSSSTGRDRGFLWRLNAYWRYEAVTGGVIAECESVSLSRSVPFGLGAVVGPIIRSTARESLEKALQALKSTAVTRSSTERTPPASSTVR